MNILLEPLESLWRNRQLFRRVLNRDILSMARGSVLGLAWIVVIPLVLVAIYTFVFGVILPSTWSAETHSPLEVPLIFFTGLTVFGFFMEVFTRAPNVIRDNRVDVKKIVFPLSILAWMLAGTAMFKLLINFALLLVFLVLLTGGLPAKVLLVPVLLTPFVVMTVGLAWIVAAIGTYIRDLPHAIQALTPIVMFVSPIFYAIQQVPESVRGIYMLNPLTFVLEGVRSLLFFGAIFPLRGLALYSFAALLVYAAGYVVFQRLRPGFSDVV